VISISLLFFSVPQAPKAQQAQETKRKPKLLRLKSTEKKNNNDNISSSPLYNSILNK
jgi:hypothetical protein